MLHALRMTLRSWLTRARWTWGHPIIWIGTLRPGDRLLLDDLQAVEITHVYEPDPFFEFQQRCVAGYHDDGRRFVCVYPSDARVRLAPPERNEHR